MTDETREALRLLVECADMVRLLDDGSPKVEELRMKLRAYFERVGLYDPDIAERELFGEDEG